MKKLFTNPRYKDGRFARRYQGLPMCIGYIFLAIIVYAVIVCFINNKPLISPKASEIVRPVYASEKVTVSCENPKGYLECKVYKGEITWKEHDLLSKIIKCESSWNQNAIHVNTNGTLDRGLFQSNSIHSSLNNESAFNYKLNIDWGIKLFKSQGTTPWNSSHNCWK